MPDANDFALLREYADCNSESAFSEIVHRHINLVYSVALRFTGNGEDAQDVTQAAFVILAKKAADISPKIVLTGWLYETTRFTAMNFLTSKTRRHAREQEAYMQSVLDSNTESIWRQLAPMLEEAMTRLSEKERTLVALRFFENRSLAETAAALGIQEWAARKRVERTIDKLQQFFAKRGVTSTTATLARAISANSVQAAPVALAKSVAAVAIVKGAAATTSTSTLVKGALKIMAWSKAKTAIVVGVVILAAAGGSTIAVKKLEHKHTEFPANAVQQFVQTSGGSISMEAVKFITSLKQKGQLPGIVSNTPASIEIPWISFDRPNGMAHFINTNLSFPVSLTLTVHANDVNERYHYTIAKITKANDWQLHKAWCSDTNGTVLKQFQIP